MSEMTETTKDNLKKRIEDINTLIEKRGEHFHLLPAPELPFVTMASPDYNCSPRIKLTEPLLEKSDDGLADYACRLYNENARNIDAKEFIDPDYVLENVMPRVDPAWNKEQLEREHIVYKKWNEVDLLISFYLVPTDLGIDDDATPCLRISKSLLNATGLDTEQLYSAAVKNIDNSYRIQTINDVLYDMVGDGEDTPAQDTEEATMLVLTNTQSPYGAATLLSSKMLQEVSERIGEKYVLLPSSIYEVLATKYLEPGCEEQFRHMIQEVNESQVMPEDRLGQDPYVWDNGVLSIAERQMAE